MITIVSGLPRSGTSLMMQMLQAGGMPLLVDDSRPPDQDNPRGYFEYGPVKSLETDNAWLPRAEGKALKVVSQLLYHLPRRFHYKILFMRRDLDEVLRSQEEMLQRRKTGEGPPRDLMKAHFQHHLTTLDGWLSTQPHLAVRDCHFRELVQTPEVAILSALEFLGLDLDPKAMSAVVDRSLYRQRAR
ncbi:MAG: sulfotransferase family protein [Pirellulales bacterium]|nr:sulfotransferase family protein [Pirellulales bacterium]